jgi:predicted DNA-binding transcriptional regulator AlpA
MANNTTACIWVHPPKQINRKQIAAKLGVHASYMYIIAKEGRANMPKPVTERTASGIFYLEYEIDAWIVANIDQIIIQSSNRKIKNKAIVDRLTGISITPLNFIQGKFERQALQNKNQLKRLASSIVKPGSVSVVTPYNKWGEIHG